MRDHEDSHARVGRPSPRGAVAVNEARGPVHWPTLSALDAQREWPLLRAWVDELRERYPQDLDHHVIPQCWSTHESHVMVLQALKDFERLSYGPSAPASGPIDFFRAYQTVTTILRNFTANLKCGAEHFPSRPVPPIDESAFENCVTQDIARRRRRAIDAALNDSVLENMEWGSRSNERGS